jgi:Subtilase family
VRLGGPSTLSAELGLASQAGAFIHSNSWHRNTNAPRLPTRGLPPVYSGLDREVDNFTFANENHLVVGSAGNRTNELGPPGTAKNALCVGAAQADPNEMNFGNGNPGPTADGRRKPDLMAVGCGIESARVNTPCETVSRNCFSSYATPHAAAAAALVRQYFLDGWYPSGEKRAADSLAPTGSLLKAVLLNSTQDMTGAGVAGYPSNAEGWGLIRLDRTLFFRGARRRLRVWDQPHAAGVMPAVDFHPYDFDVADETEQLKITLVWSDPAPFFLAFFGAPIVNDLNLEVTAPDGTRYLGNDFTNRVSTPNGNTRDALNTVEMVIVNNPAPGRWQLLVHGIVNQGNPGQGYALVATANLKSKCFVASAVYGDETHPDVGLMRSWRDRSLAGGGARAAGMRGLAAAYERIGPPLGEAVRRHPRVARLLRDRFFGPAAAAARRRRARRLQVTCDGNRVGPSRGRRE